MYTRIFNIDGLKTALDGEIADKAGKVSGDSRKTVATTVASLSGSFHKQTDVLGKVEWALSFVSGWVVVSVPTWGLAAMVGSQGLICGYSVLAGLDYLDWSEDRLLDYVDGVRHVVDSELTHGPSTT